MDPLGQDLFGHFLLALILLPAAWKICRRAGFGVWLALLILVPYLGYLSLSLTLAFAVWPLNQAKSQEAKGRS